MKLLTCGWCRHDPRSSSAAIEQLCTRLLLSMQRAVRGPNKLAMISC
jgi:hypothetical protein